LEKKPDPIYATFPPRFEDPDGRVVFLLKNLYGSTVTAAPFQFGGYPASSLVASHTRPGNSQFPFTRRRGRFPIRPGNREGIPVSRFGLPVMISGLIGLSRRVGSGT
jgi:hypothetical protein